MYDSGIYLELAKCLFVSGLTLLFDLFFEQRRGLV